MTRRTFLPMQIFLYEFITGGGLWHAGEEPRNSSLLREAAAMSAAIARDFSQLDEATLLMTRDVRLEPLMGRFPGDVVLVGNAADELRAVRQLAAVADWTLIIAPETDGVLLKRCRLAEASSSRLLSPGSATVAVASDKQRAAELLAAHGVPVSHGRLLEPRQALPDGLPFPLVIKPVDRCGSEGVRLVRNADEYDRFIGNSSARGNAVRCEEFVSGLAASVAVLSGPAANYALPACQQRLSADGRFTYLGGRLPLSTVLDERARRLALRAINALPEPRGYLGVDLVLGEPLDGSGDRVIEINPRLTTSYIGLRRLAKCNLAAAMLAVVQGESPDLCFGNGPVEFNADGTFGGVTS
jgi:predicted ATP-grasp superfamily ATP-dependent carboligase